MKKPLKPTQGRNAPAYQEYAAEMLSKREYRVLDLSEKGLLDLLRRECWVNKSVPGDAAGLARYLGCQVSEIITALPKIVGPFLSEKGGVLTCPELENYRAYQDFNRNRMSDGGKQSAGKINAARRAASHENSASNPVSPPVSYPVSPPVSQADSPLVKTRQDQTRQVKTSLSSVPPSTTLASTADEKSTCVDYAKASRGE